MTVAGYGSRTGTGLPTCAHAGINIGGPALLKLFTGMEYASPAYWLVGAAESLLHGKPPPP